MTDRNALAEKFEEQRPRLRAVAYRMLRSATEADDAVQEAWLRLSGTPAEVDDLGAWLTTVVARIALNMIRARRTRTGVQVPEPAPAQPSAEQDAVLANTIGLALLVVLENLAPAERVAFVLHDVFGMGFDEVAPIVERTPEAARQLASRARRRVQSRGATSDADVSVQRNVVEAFLVASRDGDLARLIAILDPEVVLRVEDTPSEAIEVRGAENVARRASSFSRLGLVRLPVLVDGNAGALALLDGKPFSVMTFAIRDARIVAIAILRSSERLTGLELGVLP